MDKEIKDQISELTVFWNEIERDKIKWTDELTVKQLLIEGIKENLEVRAIYEEHTVDESAL